MQKNLHLDDIISKIPPLDSDLSSVSSNYCVLWWYSFTYGFFNRYINSVYSCNDYCEQGMRSRWVMILNLTSFATTNVTSVLTLTLIEINSWSSHSLHSQTMKERNLSFSDHQWFTYQKEAAWAWSVQILRCKLYVTLLCVCVRERELPSLILSQTMSCISNLRCPGGAVFASLWFSRGHEFNEQTNLRDHSNPALSEMNKTFLWTLNI